MPDAAALDDDALALAEPLPLTIAGLADAGEEQQSDGMPAHRSQVTAGLDRAEAG